MNILKQAIEAVINQGEQSASNGICMYRQDELKCAVGHLITDENYNRELEACSLHLGNEIHDALNQSLGYEVSEQEIRQLQNIQVAHDRSEGSSFLEEFKSRIRHRINQGKLPEELRELVS